MPTFGAYYRRFFLRLLKDAAPWARDNILWGAITLVAPLLIASVLHIGNPDWQLVWIALYCYLAAFTIYALSHWLRTAWRLDADRANELSKSEKVLEQAQEKIQGLTWPTDHPTITFEKWTEDPQQNAYKQRGFLLKNEGGPALEVRIEEFAVGTQRWGGKNLSRVGRSETAFALIWWIGGNQFEKFDLLSSMRGQAGPGGILAPDESVRVSAVYRDAHNNWYRSQADLTYIRSQDQLRFEPTTIEKVPDAPPQRLVFQLNSKSFR